MLKTTISIIALATILHTPAMAREWSTTSGLDRNESRVQLGLTMPLGKKSGSESKPRLELTLTQDRISHDGERMSWRHKAPRQSRIGFTLDREQTFMLNGREMHPKGERKNISTGAAIGIGLGVILVGALVIATANNFDDLDFNRNR